MGYHVNVMEPNFLLNGQVYPPNAHVECTPGMVHIQQKSTLFKFVVKFF